MPAGLSFNTAVSFLTNTNWQNYVRRAHDEPSHPDGRAGLPQLRVGRGRCGGCRGAHPRAWSAGASNTIGNFWVDLVRTCIRVLLPLSFVFALVLVSQGVDPELPLAADRPHVDRADADDRPGGRSPARRPSRRSVRTAVASSTPTPRTRTRTPTGSRTCSRYGCCWPSRSRSRSCSARSSATCARAGWCSPPCSCSGSRRPRWS